MRLIPGIVTLLGCQLVGEVIVQLAGLKIPGPVAGMVVLLAFLQLRRPSADADIYRVGDGLLAHLQLLFVPAGVGVIAYVSLIGDNALPIGAALVLSWLLGMLAIAAVASLLAKGQPHG